MNYFDTIYKAAKAKDSIALKQALEKGCIDEFKVGHINLSAAAELAREGDVDSVNFLLSHGACVKYVAYGAALGANIEYNLSYVRELIRNYPGDIPLLNFIAGGAAKGGYFDFIKMLLNEYPECIEAVVSGAAWGGHFDFLNEMNLDPKWTTDIARFAARGGYFEHVNKLIRESNDPAINIEAACQGAAEGGYFEFIRQHVPRYPRGAFVRVVMGAARGGHENAEAKLLYQCSKTRLVTLGACLGNHCALADAEDVSSIIKGVAQAGDIVFAKKLVVQFSDFEEELVLGAARGGHFNYLREILLASPSYIYLVAKNAIEFDYISRANPKQQLAFLAQFHPSTIPVLVNCLYMRNSLTGAIHEKAIKVDKAIELKAITLSKIMDDYHVTYPVAELLESNSFHSINKINMGLDSWLITLPADVLRFFMPYLLENALYPQDVSRANLAVVQKSLCDELQKVLDASKFPFLTFVGSFWKSEVNKELGLAQNLIAEIWNTKNENELVRVADQAYADLLNQQKQTNNGLQQYAKALARCLTIMEKFKYPSDLIVKDELVSAEQKIPVPTLRSR